MNFLFPIAAIFCESLAKTVDKLNFARNHIAARQLMLLIFIGMSISLLIYIVLTKQPLPMVSLVSLSLLVLIGLVSFASNIFDVLSLKVDDLSLREPLTDFHPISAGLIGYLLFPAQREPIFIAVFIIGAIVVYYGSHRRKLRGFQKKGMHFFLLATIFESVLPSIYQVTLGYINPTYIAFFRVIGVLLLALFFFPLKPTLKALDPKKISYSLASGVIYAVGAVAGLYAIYTLGIVQTMLLLLLGPSLRYLAGCFILKEKVRKGEVLSSLLLSLMVVVAVLV